MSCLLIAEHNRSCCEKHEVFANVLINYSYNIRPV